MSRKFRLSNDWYACDFKMFKKKNIVLEEGLTVLVGCNGAGKTTLLKQIENNLNKNNIPVLYHDNLTNGERALREKSLWTSDLSTLARTVINSEGENIVEVMGFVAKEIGQMVRDNPDSKEYWILLDAVDSGLDIDNINTLKQDLVKFILDTESSPERKFYFIISANSYEMARGEKCFGVTDCEYMNFANYEEYRNFIIENKRRKDKEIFK